MRKDYAGKAQELKKNGVPHGTAYCQVRKDLGLCVQCGKEPAVRKSDGTLGTLCEKHREKNREYMKNYLGKDYTSIAVRRATRDKLAKAAKRRGMTQIALLEEVVKAL